MDRCYYTILGVKETASPAEIHEAYRRLARAFHPDVSGADTAPQFLEVQQAWDTLGNADRRRAYDEEMGGRRPTRRIRDAATARRGDTVTEGWSPGPVSPWRRTPAAPEAVLHLELQLSRAEARRGGRVPVDLPALVPCRFCEGSGRGLLSWCPACRGSGTGIHGEGFELDVPAGLGDGQVVEIPLRGLRLLHSSLVIHARIVG